MTVHHETEPSHQFALSEYNNKLPGGPGML